MAEKERALESDNVLADELLAVRCQLGEPAAFTELVERWHQPLWNYVLRMTDGHDTAADALQDVWLRVLRSLPRLQQPGRLRSWLFSIARRTVMDRLRVRYASPEIVPVEEVEVPVDDPGGDLEEDLHLLSDTLARMPFIERDALVLFYLDELTIEQMTEILGIPVGTVKSRLFRARRMLRQQLLEQGIQR